MKQQACVHNAARFSQWQKHTKKQIYSCQVSWKKKEDRHQIGTSTKITCASSNAALPSNVPDHSHADIQRAQLFDLFNIGCIFIFNELKHETDIPKPEKQILMYLFLSQSNLLVCLGTAAKREALQQHQWQRNFFDLFFCLLLGYVSRAVRPSVSWYYPKRTNPKSWERQKHSSLKATPMNELIKQIQQINPPSQVSQRREDHSGVKSSTVH